jgi:hypothetical protein
MINHAPDKRPSIEQILGKKLFKNEVKKLALLFC